MASRVSLAHLIGRAKGISEKDTEKKKQNCLLSFKDLFSVLLGLEGKHFLILQVLSSPYKHSELLSPIMTKIHERKA